MNLEMNFIIVFAVHVLLVAVFFIDRIDGAVESCKHRYDYRYHQNPTINNPYLYKALEDYSIFHINATAGTNVTEDLLRIAMHTDSSASRRYLYLDLSASGLGNRLNTLLSGFLYAVLSRRVLLIASSGYR